MKDEEKTKKKLITELKEMRRRITELETSEPDRTQREEVLRESARIRESEERFRDFANMLPGIIYEIDDKGMVTYLNRWAFDATGYTQEDIERGLLGTDIITPDGREKAWQDIDRMLNRRDVVNSEFALSRKNGSTFSVVAQSAPIVRGENVVGMRGVVFDITDRKQTEEALRESEEKLRISFQQWQITFDAMTDAVMLLNTEGRILQHNQAMANMLKNPNTEIIGRCCWELMHGTSGPIEGCPVIRMQESLQREILVLSQGGRTFEVTADPVLDDFGNLTGAVHIISDITERKQAEQEREKLITKLKEAISKIKTLSGMLPICTTCKKIRDDKGYWNRIEKYIMERSETEFSHSMCPECMDKLYGDEDWYKKE